MLHRLPSAFATGYWRCVLASPNGELWFGHTSAAPQEMDDMASALKRAIRNTGRSTPDLDALLEPLRRSGK
jgi:hypothetical protein